MRLPGRLLPRDAAESVTVFVAAVLVAGAAVSAHESGHSVRETPSVEVAVVAGPQRAGTPPATHAPSSTVSVLGRVPVSTRAPLAGSKAGTAATTGTDAPRVNGSATTPDDPGPWLGGTETSDETRAGATSAPAPVTSTATTTVTATVTTTTTATTSPSPSTTSAPSPSTAPAPGPPTSAPPTTSTPPPTPAPTPTSPATPTPTTAPEGSPSVTTGDGRPAQDGTTVPAPTTTAP